MVDRRVGYMELRNVTTVTGFDKSRVLGRLAAQQKLKNCDCRHKLVGDLFLIKTNVTKTICSRFFEIDGRIPRTRVYE